MGTTKVKRYGDEIFLDATGQKLDLDRATIIKWEKELEEIKDSFPSFSS